MGENGYGTFLAADSFSFLIFCEYILRIYFCNYRTAWRNNISKLCLQTTFYSRKWYFNFGSKVKRYFHILKFLFRLHVCVLYSNIFSKRGIWSLNLMCGHAGQEITCRLQLTLNCRFRLCIDTQLIIITLKSGLWPSFSHHFYCVLILYLFNGVSRL